LSNSFEITTDNGAKILYSTFEVNTNVVADGVAQAQIKVTLKNLLQEPLQGLTPTISASGTGNALSGCSASDENGLSICVLTSTKAQNKTITINTPFSHTLSDEITFIAGNAYRLVLVTGDGQTAKAAAPVAIAPKVRVEDEHGNPVSGYRLSFSVLTGGGTLSHEERYTNALGEAEVSWILGEEAGDDNHTIKVIAHSLEDALTGTPHELTFTASSVATNPHKLVFLNAQRSFAAAGCSEVIEVQIQDEYENIKTLNAQDGAMTLTIGPDSGAGAFKVFSDADCSTQITSFEIGVDESLFNFYIQDTLMGVHELRIDSSNFVLTAATQNYTTQAASAHATHSTIAGTSGIIADGEGASEITIILKDNFQNPVSGVTPTFSVTGSNNILGACSQTNGEGVSTCSFTSTKAESKEIALITPVARAGNSVNFVHGEASRLVFHSQPQSSSIGGGLGDFKVLVQDFNGNPVEDSSITVSLSLENDAHGSAGLSGQTAKEGLAGEASFDSVYLDFQGIGFRLRATSGSLTPAVSDAFDIVPPCDLNPQAVDSIGQGTEGRPYILCTATQLNAIGANEAYMDKHFKMMSDIDLDGITFIMMGGTGDTTGFKGVFDGNGFVVKNIVLGSGNFTGFFRRTQGALIKNLGLENVSRIATGNVDVGTLIGRAEQTSVQDSYATGSLYGIDVVGGLVGRLLENSEIIKSYSKVTVTAPGSNVGGMVGSLNSSQIRDSYSNGNVYGNGSPVGGLVGILVSSQIYNSYATGNVIGDRTLGGLIGRVLQSTTPGIEASVVSQSYAIGDVRSKTQTNYARVGGLIGLIDTGATNVAANVIVTHSFATGSVTVQGTTTMAGGLIGANHGKVYNSYATGDVFGASQVGGLIGVAYAVSEVHSSFSTGLVIGNGTEVGGLVGFGTSFTGSNLYWDIDRSARTNGSGSGDHAGISGKTTAQMSSQNTAEYAGLNFTDDWELVGYGTPRLKWEKAPYCNPSATPFGGGDGSIEAPYTLCSPGQLNEIGETPEYMDKHFVLVQDLDLGGIATFNRIGGTTAQTAFTGVFDGSRNVISNLTVNPPGPATNRNSSAMFRTIGGSAEIRSLGLENVDVSGYGNVGVLVAVMQGESKVLDSYSTGSVRNNNWYVGGLIGTATDHSKVIRSYSKANVLNISSHAAGGLVANLSGFAEIIDSYASGKVEGTGSLYGGLVSIMNDDARVYRSYASGVVTGGQSVGGLVGRIRHQAVVDQSYASGFVVSLDSYRFGGLIGNREGTTAQVKSSYWDIDGTGQVSVGPIAFNNGATGLTRSEMGSQDKNIFDNFDFISNWKFVGYGPPRLEWEKTSGCNSLATPFGRGNGSSNYPYLICSADQLNSIGDDPEYMEKHFELVWHLDLEGVAFNMIGGVTEATGFKGTFDGADYTISNLTMNEPTENVIGLFRVISASGNVQDLSLSAFAITGHETVGALAGVVFGEVTNVHSHGDVVSKYSSAGGLVGDQNGGKIENSSSSGTVESETWTITGGLVGRNQGGQINLSHSSANVEGGHHHVGGLVGSMTTSGTVSDSYATGAVTGRNQYTGGLVGYMSGSTVIRSYALGTVTGTSANTGGLVGYSQIGTISQSYAKGDVFGAAASGGLVGGVLRGTIEDSFASGNVNGTQRVGGLIGLARSLSSAVLITRTYATGNVTGASWTNQVGGLIGFAFRDISGGICRDFVISESYSTGHVSGTVNFIGGLVGQTTTACSDGGNVEFNNSYWNVSTAGITDSAGGQPLTSSEMASAANFNTWVFSPDPNYIWWMDTDEGRPRLWWE
jgi:hypothetical protein